MNLSKRPFLVSMLAVSARRNLQNLFAWFCIWITISFLFFMKIPSAFTKIYAEDGSIYLQEALKTPFPNDYFLPYAGYIDIIARTGGQIASILPLQYAAHTFFFFNSLMMTWIALTVYTSASEIIPSRINRSFLTLCLVLLPIANFESIANTTNLHFFFMSACLPIFLRKSASKTETWAFAIFVLASCLSTPLMLFYFPLIAYLRITSSDSGGFAKFKPFDYAWLIGIVTQVIFIVFRAFGERTTTGVNPIGKTGYLYLDRVFGTTFIPGWGNVSENTSSILPGYFSTKIYLALRGVFALLVLSLFVFYLAKMVKRNAVLRPIVIIVLITGLFYWFVVGTLFNPEPRYAIFPSFGLLCILLYVHSNHLNLRRIRLWQAIIFILIGLTWMGSWTPSSLRTEGPSWATEFQKARAKCGIITTDVQIPIVPTNADWHVLINCERIL